MKYYSENLKQNIEVAKYGHRMTVTCEDGTFYDANEMDILIATGKKTPYVVHLIKGTFKGEIVTPGNEKRKKEN